MTVVAVNLHCTCPKPQYISLFCLYEAKVELFVGRPSSVPIRLLRYSRIVYYVGCEIGVNGRDDEFHFCDTVLV